MYKVICLLAAFCCLITLSACAKKQQTVIEQTAEYMRAGLESQQTETAQSDASPEAPVESDEVEQPEEAPDEQKPPYESPVDFESLWRENSDIYAWLDLPGTKISDPILQRDGEDTYYLKHDAHGQPSSWGSIFTESLYNTTTFADPVTVIYGHQMYDGSMFSSLQRIYSAPSWMEESRELVIYQKYRELHYEIFAAVPTDSRHLLYSYDFTDEDVFTAFFDTLLHSRALDAQIVPDASVSPDDRVVILSTCYAGDYSKRFLVLAKLTQIVD